MERFSDDEKQAVFDLVSERLFELFGPGGSFRVTLGRAAADDAVFVSTVSDTIAWQVASSLVLETKASGSHATAQPEEAEHDHLWRHIEEELLAQRQASQSIPVQSATAQVRAA
ncbi:MAG: hypothetical protein Q8M65_04140 [Rhodoglobus sp.]|nr:hypothetical protein [Rhodoglobus sp.]